VVAITPKRRASSTGDGDHADRHVGAVADVVLQHPPVVHLVDVVAREDQDALLPLRLDRVEVLGDGVGGAEVPALLGRALRRERRDELREAARQEVPAEPQVVLERARTVLRQRRSRPE
jgi:hypothetical protein